MASKARRRFVLAACALLVAAGVLVAEDLPPAPDGFTWHKIDSIKAAFLVPAGWYYLEETKDDVRGIFISQEEIRGGGEFSTGLTINVQKVKKGTAQDRATKAVALYALVGKVQDAWEMENGVLKLYGARIHVTADPPAFTEHFLAIGNSRTDTLYTILFESPDPTWVEAWKKGEVILKDFRLDDEI